MMRNMDQAQPPSRWALENTRVQKALGITPQQYDCYRVSVGKIESGNNPNMGAGGAGNHYWGPYQFGAAATESTNKYLHENVQRQQFKGNQALAERHFDALSCLNHETLMRVSPRYRGMTPTEKLCVLGYAHNQGAGGAAKWLSTGREGRDAFGTSGKKYFDAIMGTLKAIGQFILDGFKAVGKVIEDIFTPQKQEPPPRRWKVNLNLDQSYTSFNPPPRWGINPEQPRSIDRGWVNQRMDRSEKTNVVMGDSISVGMASQYPGAKNVGVGGVSIGAAAAQFRKIPRGSVADVYLGSNNAGYSEQENRRQIQHFLKSADEHGVRINNWVLPAEYEGAKHARTDVGLAKVADLITSEVERYNAKHESRRSIQTIVTRDRGIEKSGDGLHWSPQGARQAKMLIAEQRSKPGSAVARADQDPDLPTKWHINLNPKRTA